MSSKAQPLPGYQQHHVGEHWSGSNPIPTVQNFIEHFDKDKRERDRKIEEESKARREQEKRAAKEGKKAEEQPKQVPKEKVKTRKVTDPVTGREIEIEDKDQASMEGAKNPKVWILFLPTNQEYPMLSLLQLTVPNANLGKPTVSLSNLLSYKLVETELITDLLF